MTHGATEFDFIEFHDGTIERIDRPSADEVVIVFDHLYVCVRQGNDHAGWSYRAELVLSAVTSFTVDGDMKLDAPTRHGQVFIDDGEVRDEAGEVIGLRALLDATDARTFSMQYFSPTPVLLSADIQRAKLVLVEAVRRIEDCYLSGTLTN